MAPKPKMSSGNIVALCVAVLLTGMLNTCSTKVLFSQYSTGADGKSEKFTKPWFGAWNMLTAMLLVGIIDAVFRRLKGETKTVPMDTEAPFVPKDTTGEYSYMQKALIVAVPGCFDLLATGLRWIGILYIPASIVMILRGSCIIFTAIGARIVFGAARPVRTFQVVGLSLCMGGIGITGLAQVTGGSSGAVAGDDSSIAFGMGMVVLAQIVQAVQLVGEEWLMKGCDLPGFQVVGWEGFWGVIVMIVFVYPVLWALPGQDHGHMEDAFDTFEQIKNSSAVQALALTYLFSCATFNATGIVISGVLSAVHRVILVAITTLLIWGFGLYVHYCYDSTSEFGEVWTPYSPIQLVGFCFLVMGQAVYGQLVKLPGLEYPRDTPANCVAPKSPSNAFGGAVAYSSPH